MKIAYIIVGENINSDLLKRQVIELLIKIKQKNRENSITIFNIQGLLSIFNHYKELSYIKERLNDEGISHITVPNIFPWPIPNLKLVKLQSGWRPYSVWNKMGSSIFSKAAIPFYFILRKLLRYEIIHCRSYPAALSAITYKKIFKDLKVLFDPRSDFPEEGITAGFWKENSADYQFWKSKEKELLEKSNATALIGPTYLNHYKKHVNQFEHFFAPNNVNTNQFKENKTTRKQIREKLEYGEKDFVFVYAGSLTEDGWHRIEFYKKFHDLVIKTNEKSKLLLIIPKKNAKPVKNSFDGLPGVTIVSPSHEEVADYMVCADAGLMFLHRKKIAVGTKIGEYLCCNLPVLTNKNCLGAVDLLKKNEEFGQLIGLDIGDLDSEVNLENFDLDLLKKYQPAFYSKSYFDLEVIAEIYLEKYDAISKI